LSLFDILLPDVPELVLSKIYYGPQRLLLFTTSLAAQECCPLCHKVSEKVHSHYTRRVGDLPWSDFKIELLIQVRRFYCTNSQCRRFTFAQRLGQAIPAYARRTQRRTNQLQNLGLALGGEAGARMAKSLQISTSPDTILRSVRRLPLPPSGEVRVVGIDDFAFRRGRNYGTILVDLEDHIVIDLLPDIKKETVIEWLKGHPEIEIISRDRASAFAEAGRVAAPQALQIADRFHISQNLWETCEALIKQNYSTIRQVLDKQNDEVRPGIEGLLAVEAAIKPAEEASQPRRIEEVTSTQVVSMQPVVRERPQEIMQTKSAGLKEVVALNSRERKKQETRNRRLAIYQEVKTLQERGFSRTEIAQKLGTNVTQVRRYLKGVPIHGGSVQQKTILDPYKAHLKRRYFEDHFDNIKELWREIQTQGYSGSYGGVSAYLIQLKFEQDVVELTGRPITKRVKAVEKKLPSIRRLSWSLFLPAHRLKVSQSEQLQLILRAEPKLSRGYTLVQQFTKLMAQRTDVGLTEWLIEVEGSEIEPLKSFVRGVRRDEEAVRAGLKSRWWSQGPVEGFVNKLKLVKRSAFGRASFQLLRTRILLA
jgi:transposase